jgi:ribosomal protein L3 glutamine methyltransferase
MTLTDWVGQVERQLVDAKLFFGHGTDNAFDEAAWLVMSAAGIDLNAKLVNWRQVLSDSQQSSLRKLVERRIESRKPLAYLLKNAWFAGLQFYIDERAIIPRSYIGEWISVRFEPWLGGTPVKAVLDLCTGSGCIAIALALAFPKAKVDAADISTAALEVAAINIERYALGQRIRLLQGDLFHANTEAVRYDLIICNPPYVSDQSMASLPVEYGFEPRLALAGGRDGLDFVHRVLTEVRPHLKETGRLFMEAGSTAAVVEKTWPGIPFTWLSALTGECAVLTLTAAELDRYGEHFAQPER